MHFLARRYRQTGGILLADEARRDETEIETQTSTREARCLDFQELTGGFHLIFLLRS